MMEKDYKTVGVEGDANMAGNDDKTIDIADGELLAEDKPIAESSIKGIVESSSNDVMIREDENDSNVHQKEIVGYDKDLIEARRVRQLEMRFAGFKPTTQIYPVLAKEFHCNLDTLHHDWVIRDKWLDKAARLADIPSIMAESKITGEVVQSRFREATKSIYDELNRHVDEEGNIDWSDPVVPLLYGFLRDYLKGTMESNSAQIKNLAKLGIIKEEPRRVQVEEKSLNVNINAFDVLDESDRMKLFGALFEGGKDEN